MRRAHFIVGFNNWGKTTTIFDLFDGRTRFYYGYDYSIQGINPTARFMVQSQSNDDVGWDFIRRIGIRIKETAPRTPDLIAAFCPSMEANNNFCLILGDTTFDAFDEFHFFFLKYKWEHHAELLIPEIQRTYNNLRPNSHFHIIDDGNILVDQRLAEKKKQIKQILLGIYP